MFCSLFSHKIDIAFHQLLHSVGYLTPSLRSAIRSLARWLKADHLSITRSLGQVVRASGPVAPPNASASRSTNPSSRLTYTRCDPMKRLAFRNNASSRRSLSNVSTGADPGFTGSGNLKPSRQESRGRCVLRRRGRARPSMPEDSLPSGTREPGNHPRTKSPTDVWGLLPV